MKALIAVDGSAGGFEAVRQVGQMLDPERDQVAFFYAPPSIHLDSGVAEPGLLDRARTSLATAVFDEAKKLLPAGLQSGTHTIIGTQAAKQGIVPAAAEWGAQLISVGARGLGPIERLLMGSVSRSVVSEAKVPVLVARPRPATRATAPWRILVAYESPAKDGPTADLINQLHWPPASQGHLISVVQSMFAGHVPQWLKDRARSEEVEAMSRAWVEEHEAEIKTKQADAAAFKSTLPDAWKTTEPIIVEGHAADKILDVAAKQQIDLIIMGPGSPSLVERLVMGSTSLTVLNHAPCSVLIARPLRQP